LRASQQPDTIRTTISVDTIVLPTLSIKNPYSPLIFHGCKKYETRAMPMLRNFCGKYMLLHISLKDKDDNKMGRNTVTSIIGRNKRITAARKSMPAGWPSNGYVVAIMEMGETEFVGRVEAARDSAWEDLTFVSRETFFSEHTDGLFATRLVRVHPLEHPVKIPRGYVGVHPCTLPISAIPASIDGARLHAESTAEKTRSARWIAWESRVW